MAEIESAWDRYPDYRIDLVPCRATVKVWHGDLLLAESEHGLVLTETDHTDRLYIPESDVHLELFEATDHHSVCPFKGEADYWTLAACDPPVENVAWAYRRPFDEVAGIAGHVCFYDDRVRVELVERWPGEEAGAVTTNRFPVWGDAIDLLELVDVQPLGDGRFVGPPYRDRTRNVVEGGQLLAQAIVAASKSVPGQRVTSASMLFPKAAGFDAPLELEVDILRAGRSFSTVEVRITQDGTLRSVGLLLLDAGAPDVIRGGVEMPDVDDPGQSEPYDMRVTGRDLRIVDGAYSPDPELVGPPEINAWMRFRDAPAERYLHTALMAQSTTHWTIAAAMRPHRGFGEADAHVTLSTGIMGISLAIHDDVDVTGWLLYSNPAIQAGRGLVQGEGHVFTREGHLVASYTVQGMVRRFGGDPAAAGLDAGRAM